MAMKWTEEQQKVITLRDRNILVSAAAGSGKTAVLVQRILSKIMDPLRPVDIDRLLIMTFTRAAAGEMRERIERALDTALAEDPREYLPYQSEACSSSNNNRCLSPRVPAVPLQGLHRFLFSSPGFRRGKIIFTNRLLLVHPSMYPASSSSTGIVFIKPL